MVCRGRSAVTWPLLGRAERLGRPRRRITDVGLTGQLDLVPLLAAGEFVDGSLLPHEPLDEDRDAGRRPSRVPRAGAS